MTRIATASEHDEQAALVRWAALHAPTIPALAWLAAIPNGGHRDKRTAARLKAEGVRRGVPDLVLPWPCRGMAGLWIELKADRGRPSPDQVEWIEYLNEVGYRAVVAWGWQQAAREILDYLGIPAERGGL